MAYDFYDEKYMTKQGETWESISMDFYGTPYKINELISSNRKFSDVVIFDENVALNIPILPEDAATSLAPWKREE